MDIEAATHKRDPNCGFTYDKKKPPEDKRQHIPLQGQKTCHSSSTLHFQQALFIRNKTVHGRDLSGFAYIAATVMSRLV
eukprot:scaffold66576_cov27-Attheya_sp.AAC.1